MPQFLALDVTMSQAKVLHILSVTPGASMSGLASGLGVSLPTASGLVDRLAEHGLVGRHAHPDDRRHVLVSLTDKGREVIDSFYEVGRQHLRRLLLELDDVDLVGLCRGLSALAAAARLSRAIPDERSPGLDLDHRDQERTPT